MEARAERLMRRLVSVVRASLRPLGRPLAPALRTWRRIPVELRVGGIVLAFFLGSFFAAVVPLLLTGGRDPRAEVSGRYPGTMTVGQTYVLPVAVDNTSGAVISPLCLIAGSGGPGGVTPVSAEFQGLETVRFVNGRACAGALSGQEVISVSVTYQPRTPGSTTLTLVASENGTEIGPRLTGTVAIITG